MREFNFIQDEHIGIFFKNSQKTGKEIRHQRNVPLNTDINCF